MRAHIASDFSGQSPFLNLHPPGLRTGDADLLRRVCLVSGHQLPRGLVVFGLQLVVDDHLSDGLRLDLRVRLERIHHGFRLVRVQGIRSAKPVVLLVVQNQRQPRDLLRHLRVGSDETQDSLIPIRLVFGAEALFLHQIIEVSLQIQFLHDLAAHRDDSGLIRLDPRLDLLLQSVGAGYVEQPHRLFQPVLDVDLAFAGAQGGEHVDVGEGTAFFQRHFGDW